MLSWLFGFFVGAIITFLVFANDFTIGYGNFGFSVKKNQEAAFSALQEEYKVRVKNMKEQAQRLANEYKNPATTPTVREKIVKKTIDYYLSPISHDKIFGHDMVLWNGKGQPTILTKDDQREINDLRVEILTLHGVVDIVKKHRIGEDHMQAWDEKAYKAALKECKLE